MSAVQRRQRKHCSLLVFTACACGCGTVMLPRAAQWVGFCGDKRMTFASVECFARYLEAQRGTKQ